MKNRKLSQFQAGSGTQKIPSNNKFLQKKKQIKAQPTFPIWFGWIRSHKDGLEGMTSEIMQK